MTKGGSSKPNMLGRLFFGEKRKQHVSPSRHRSATRNVGSTVDVPTSGGGGGAPPDIPSKSPINVHDWATWRMQLNEQMGNGVADRNDLKQMRQFLHSNSFYQQHSRDPSNGRYNGVRLLFSIPHAKLKPESNEGLRGSKNKLAAVEGRESAASDQNHVRSNSTDHTTTIVNSVPPGSPRVIDKTNHQYLPKNSIGDTGGFVRVNEQMVAADITRTRRSLRTPFSIPDRKHGTLQKAVKDGNVLEKIKAFEMQAAAAAQAESTIKSGGNNGMHNRTQSVAQIIQAATHRTMSPPTIHRIQHPISPMPIQHEPQLQQQQQQYIRSHRGRYVHPAQYRRDGNLVPLVGRESRKGAHVLEPAHGDIILKRRTPSQKTVNDEDYSITAISSMALTASQGHHRQHNYHHRSSVSRSRHRQESVHDKRSTNKHENDRKKQKQKEAAATAAAKPSSRRRWLKGRKETPTETPSESTKQDVSTTKSNKNKKNKKKNSDEEKLESTKKSTSPTPKGKTTSTIADNNRVYGVPNTNGNEQTTSPQPPSRIDEENESERDEKTIENKTNPTSSKEDHKESNPVVQRRPSKTKHQQKLSSTDAEILNKVEDDTRFSRPTDDHAHRSELNDEDDECKSDGDVFIEESSGPQQQQQQASSNTIRRQSSQHSVDEVASERRWKWSKESGGLIDKGNRKKKPSNIPVKIKTRQEEEEEQVVYEVPKSEQFPSPVPANHTLKKKQSLQTIELTNESNNTKQFSKQILHTILNNSSNTNLEQSTTDDFFENGPHTNPEETIANITSTA